MENVFYVLDIYNDAAEAALRCLRRQHLFDEIESEASLAVEHLVRTYILVTPTYVFLI